jgi:hypothetical protein
MGSCTHGDLEYIGTQKDEAGVNTYFRCRACGSVVVVTPGRNVFAIPPSRN